MGEVYLAQDTKLDRRVALKILPAEVASNRDRMDRFVREAKSAAALSHPNIAQIFEIGEHEGTHFIAMEFVEGVTLREKIHRERTELRKLLRYLQHVAEGLAKAHAAGIVHRDLKPDNVMITRDGHAKILDFGLAKLIEARLTEAVEGESFGDAATAIMQQHSTPGVIMGTVGYMSPEQAQGKTKEIDQRSDIFSFGCILFEAATGKKPFEGESVIKSLHMVVYEPAPPITDFNSSAPAELQRIVRRCLEKDADDRYQGIREVAIELKHLRRELEIGGDFDTTVPSPVSNQTANSTNSGSTIQPTAPVSASIPPALSSVEYLVQRLKRHKLVVAIALAILIGFGGLFAYYLRTRNISTSIDSIAVLPFENKSNAADTDYLSDGLAESLIYRLSQLPNLKVSPTSSVMRYKGKETDVKAVAAELGVSAVLTGRIAQRGDDLTISVELVDVRNKQLLWGEQYARKMSDLLTTQREIAAEIVQKLRLRISGNNEKGLTKHYTENNEAYQLYLKGRFYWNKRTEDGMQKSLEYFQQAIERDPNFALAYSGLADAYDLLAAPDAAGGMPANEAMPKTKAAALKALEIDDGLAEPHVSLAHVKYYYDRDWVGAEREYKRAIELNPNYPTAHQWYAVYLMSAGRFDEALAENRRAQELEPLSLPINMTLGWVLLSAREYDQSIEQLRRTLEMDPNFILTHHRLGLVYEQKGMYDEAIAEFRQVLSLSGGKPLGVAPLAHAYALSGKRAEAQKTLAELQKLSEQHYVSPASIAIIYVALGDKDQAFAWLEKADRERDGLLARLRVDPRFDSLRSDSRYADLARRIDIRH